MEANKPWGRSQHCRVHCLHCDIPAPNLMMYLAHVEDSTMVLEQKVEDHTSKGESALKALVL